MKGSWHRVSLTLLLALALLPVRAAEEQISAERIRKHVEYLASPALKGRGTGTKENDKAAAYIAAEFKRYGLVPANGGGYFQPFPVTVGAKLGKDNHAEFQHGAEKAALRVNEDFRPISFSSSGEQTLDLVFAGYGISAEEYRYDDYFHLDVKDKAVIVLRNEPQKDDEKSVFLGREMTRHASIVNKAITARIRGARAVVLVNDQPGPAEEDLLIKFGSITGPDDAGLLVIQATRAAVDKWLAPAGKNLADLQKAIDAKLEPQSFAVTGAKLHLKIRVEPIRKTTRNVAGIVRGSDAKLADEFVIIGAHYDHLGLGEKNSLAPSQAGKVHPGADDNASGTSVMLELARVIAARRAELKRSVLFLAFSGEELGLLGSAYYTGKAPLLPLEKTVAMLNLDMVGRPKDGKLTVGGVGSSPEFQKLLEEANQQAKLTLSFSQSGFGNSDHSSFYMKNVPVLFFFSGLHADYHKPSDTAEKIQFADAARVGDLAMRAALAIDAREARPQFVRVQEAPAPAGGGGGGYGAYFGSIPDMSDSTTGVKFADVRENSPAAKAGLKAGDVLIEFAGREIKNLYDFTYVLREHKPGQTVKVVVMRGNEKLSVDVKLEQRR